MAIAKFETLSYNGFEFPVETRLDIDFDHQMDQADRALVGVRHTLRAVVTLKTDQMAGRTVNGTALTGNNERDLPVIKAALDQPGQALVLTGTGFGDLSVNGNAAKKDIAWGPKPRPCSFQPLGTTACVLRWTCEVLLPTCLDATFTTPLLAAYNYSVSVSVDEQGYCTRTVSGYFEIPLTRVGGGSAVTDFAINYWNGATEPPVPAGFRRVRNEARESEDKRRLHFVVVDAEVNDILLPPHVVDAHASQTVTVSRRNLLRLSSTIRATYTLRKGVDKRLSFFYFLVLLGQKLLFMANNGATQIVPETMTLEDPDAYGRPAGNFSFTFSYTVDPNQNGATVPLQDKLRNVVPASALWVPGVNGVNGSVQSPPNNNYPLWRSSMDPVFGPGRHPGFTFGEGDDVIVDLCQSGLLPGVNGTFFRFNPGFGPTFTVLSNAQDAYLRYDIAVTVKQRSQNFLLPVVSAGADVVAFFGGVGNMLFSKLMAASNPSAWAAVSYDIIRVGSAPAIPNMTSIAGSTDFAHMRDDIATVPWALHFGVPAYRLYGTSYYALKSWQGGAQGYAPSKYLDDTARPGTTATNGIAT